MLLATLTFAWPAVSQAVDTGVTATTSPKSPSGAETQTESILQPYEPITGGYAHDSNDTGFLDVNLSLKIRLLPIKYLPSNFRPYLALATRFGFYWGTRQDSPVIGKSYNPLILLRFLPSRRRIPSPRANQFEQAEYIDFIPYAHQSNGQPIHTPDEYGVQLASLKIPSYTNNFIHRGWDYFGLVWKKTYSSDLSLYLGGTYFLEKGLLQGAADEYHAWENNSEGKPRRAVDGLSLTAEYPTSYAHFTQESPRLFSRPNVTLKYLTGYDTPFRYSTLRCELGFQILSLPLALWVQHGYLSSLAMYYQKVDSFGLEVRFENF